MFPFFIEERRKGWIEILLEQNVFLGVVFGVYS
jgi:hypothetical protein